MELELGLKITRTREDVSSSVDFRFSKDPFGSLVLSRETDSRFIIIIHLKGFKKEGIEIDINEEGNRITIRGRKPVEEMVLIRWMAWRKEVEFRFFKKVFLIPDFVDLDKIKARFDDDDATLTITMPKTVKGISGFKIEEDEEERDVNEAGHKEEEIDKGDVEEQSRDREESDEQSGKSETEIKRQEEFGEIMQDKEREGEVLGEEQKGFSGGLDEEERDVSEAEHKEEKIDKEDVEEHSRETEESDEQSGKFETEIQRQEEFGEIMQDRERESKVLGGEQKGFSGYLDEKERDVSKAEHKEEEIDKGDVEEQRRERAESDEHFQKSENEIQRQEEFEEIEQDKERVSKVLGEEQKGFSGGLDEEQMKDDNLKKIQEIDEQDQILECVEEEKKGLQELIDLNKETEDNNLRNIPNFEKCDHHEETRHEKQGLVKEQQIETTSDEFGSRALEEIEEQEPDVLDRPSKSRAIEKEMNDDDGLRKVEGIEEPARRNGDNKIQEIVEEETSDHEKKQFVIMETRDIDANEEVDGKIGEGLTPYIERIQNLVENKGDEEENAKVGTQSEDISFTKLQEIEEEQFQGLKRHKKQDKIKGLVEEQVPEADANVGNDFVNPFQGKRKSQKIFQEETKNQPEVYKEKIMATKEKIIDAAARKVHETIRQQEMDEPTGCRKESKTQELKKSKTIDGNIGEGFTQNTEGTQILKKDDIADTETKVKEFESDKLEVDEVDKIHEMVEKKEDEGGNGKVGRQSEDRSLIKLQESEEQQSMRQKRHSKHEKTKPVVEEKTPEASTNIGNDIPKSFQKIEVPEVETMGETGDEAKENKKVVNEDAKVQVDEKIGERFAPNITETETKAEEFEYDKQKAYEIDEIQKMVEKKDEEEENARVGTQSEDISLTKLQKMEEEQFQGHKQNEKQDKIKGLVREQAPEADANIGNFIVNPFQGKHKSQEIFQEKTKDQPEEYKERIMATEEKIIDAGARKFQEIIGEQELDEPSRGGKESKTRELVKSKANYEKKEKEIAETETKEQESYRPNIHKEQEKVQQLAEENTNFSKEGRVKEEKEIAKKKTEFGDNDDISRKFQDTEQRDSEVMMKGKEEILLEEKVCDDGRGIITMAETKTENDESRKVHDIDIFQKLIGGEISGHGEVEDEEKKKKKTTEVEKLIKGNARKAQEIGKKDLDASGKYIEGTTIQELENKRGNYRNEHAEEKNDETDKPKKISGTIEQELVNLKSQLEQDNVEDRENTQELIGNMIKDCDKEVGSEESITKTVDDDVMRKDPCIKGQELYEPKREHVSKIKGLIEEKTGDHENQEEKEIVESELEAEYGSLRKVKGVGVHELHEPKIHKERDKNPITRTEEPSFQEKKKEEPSSEENENIVEPMKIIESENSVDVQEIMKELPDKPDKYEEPCKISGVGEAGHNEHKEEQEENEIDRAELENEEESSKKVKEFEQQEYDEFKRSTIKDKMQEIEEKEKTRTMEENAIVGMKKTKDDGLRKVRHDEDLELSKPYTRQKDGKIQELVEVETSDYREKVKKQDENDILRIQEHVRPYLDEQSNIPQLVEEEKVGIISEVGEKFKGDSPCKFHEFEERKSYEDWTHEEQEKRKYLIKEETIDPTGKHTVGESNKDEEQEEKIITKVEPKTEEDSSKKVHEIGQQKKDEMRRFMVQEKVQETEENDKTREIEKIEIADSRAKTKDNSLKKILEGEYSELGKHKRHGEEDEIQELVEMEISDHKEKVKEKDGDDTLISQETGELERHCKPRKVHQSVEIEKGGQMENIFEPGGIVEGDSLGMFQEFQKPKSYEDWRQEGNEKTKKNVKEAAGPKDKHTDEREYEEEIYEKVAQTEMKTAIEDEINEKVWENKEPELDKEERYGKQDKLTRVLKEGESDRGKEISQELKVQEKTRVQEDEKAYVGARSENGSSREIQTIKEDELEESEEHKEQNKICETNDHEVREEDEEIVAEMWNKRSVKQKIPEYHRDVEKRTEQIEIEEMMRTSEDVSSRKVQQIKTQESDGLRKHRKLNEKYREEEMNVGGGYKEMLQAKSMALSESQDAKEKGSNQTKMVAEEENVQELMTDDGEKEDYHIREGGQNEKTKSVPHVEWKASDDISEKNETEEQELTGLRGQTKNGSHQELVDIKTNDQRKEEKEEEIVEKEETIVEHDSSRRIHEQEKRKSDEMSEKLAKKETSNDNEAGNVLGEVEMKSEDVRENEKQETARIEPKSKKIESRKIQQIEEKKTSGQERLKELVKDKSHYCIDKENREGEFEDGSSKEIQDKDKEELIDQGKDEKRDKIQEHVDREASIDDEEELEVEFEEEEEDWEAEIIQETNSYEDDNDKIRKIKRIRFGFRLVGGSTLFMSLIVIVIHFIRSKKKIRYYKS